MSETEEVKSENIEIRRILSIPNIEEEVSNNNDMETQPETVVTLPQENEHMIPEPTESKEIQDTMESNGQKRKISSILDNLLENITKKKVKIENETEDRSILLTTEVSPLSSTPVKLDNVTVEVKTKRSIFSRINPFLCSCNIQDVHEPESTSITEKKDEKEEVITNNDDSIPGITVDKTSI